MCAEQTGIIVLGHGSRYPKAREVIEKTAARYQALQPECLVRHGFVEIAKPQLEESVAALLEEGAKQIIVVPLFLAFGHHIEKDLPERMEKLRQAYQDVNLITTEPIGADPLLCDIIQARIDASVEK